MRRRLREIDPGASREAADDRPRASSDSPAGVNRAAAPGASRAGAVHALQRIAGNRATDRLLGRTRARATPGATGASEPVVERRTILVSRPMAAVTSAAGDRSGTPVQRTTDYNANDGSTIDATVDESASPITMTGSYRVDPLVVGNIAASLHYHAVSIPKAAVSTSWLAFGNVAALEITGFAAAPGGRRIGQILAWHLARVAAAQGIGYVTAGNVTGARGPFYTPLGFLDFRNAPTWTTLVARKAQLELQMAGPAGPAPNVVAEYQQVLDFMAANHIFIPTATLEANALTAWSTQWQSV